MIYVPTRKLFSGGDCRAGHPIELEESDSKRGFVQTA